MWSRRECLAEEDEWSPQFLWDWTTLLYFITSNWFVRPTAWLVFQFYVLHFLRNSSPPWRLSGHPFSQERANGIWMRPLIFDISLTLILRRGLSTVNFFQKRKQIKDYGIRAFKQKNGWKGRDERQLLFGARGGTKDRTSCVFQISIILRDQHTSSE